MKLSSWKVLTEDELINIHEASLDILSRVGVVIHSDRVLNFLKDKGLKVDLDLQRVWFSSDVIKEALSYLPSKIPLFKRDAEIAFVLGEERGLVASGHNAIYLLDPLTDGRRKVSKKDVGDFARLSHALENIDIVGVQAMPQDVLPKSSLLHALDALFNNTTKHVYFSPEDPETTRCIFRMAEAILQGKKLEKFPILTCQLSPTSPLTWEKGAVEALMLTAEAGVPCCLLPEPYAGVTAPLTLAAVLVVNSAEFLSGVVISQLVKKGAPVIYGSAWTTFDMREGNVSIGSPETSLLRIAGAQLARFYHVPSHTIGLDSDSHHLDEQNAWEKILTLLSALSSGVNLVVNAGMFATGLTVSLEQLVIDDELTGMLRRFLEGIRVSSETIATDVIAQVGPGGDFLCQPHTLKYLRGREHWQPSLSNRKRYESWQREGGLSLVERAREKVNEILEGPQPPALDEKVKKKLTSIIEEFERKTD